MARQSVKFGNDRGVALGQSGRNLWSGQGTGRTNGMIGALLLRAADGRRQKEERAILAGPIDVE